MRRFIRHPSAIPIEVRAAEQPSTPGSTRWLADISIGGLRFGAQSPVGRGTLLWIRIPLVRPPFEALVRVVWCHSSGPQFDVGAELLSPNDAFRTRMVEQVCHIEAYRRQVRETEGRELSSEQAASEWISRNAAGFPGYDA